MTILEEMYTLCDECHVETENERISDGVCSWCNEGERQVASVEPPGFTFDSERHAYVPNED